MARDFESFTAHSSFDNGVDAGKDLLKLFSELGNDGYTKEEPPGDELEPILQMLWSRTRYKEQFPSIAGFLSTILRRDDYDGGIIWVWGTQHFIEGQDNVAPVCEVPKDAGLIQFAKWTGLSDGDAWCLDMMAGRFSCLPVWCGDKDANEVRLNAYGVLPTVHQFVAYLRCDAESRGWFD